MQVRFSVFLVPVFDNVSKLPLPHGSQRTESEMLMFLPTAVPCEVSAVQSAPHGEELMHYQKLVLKGDD